MKVLYCTMRLKINLLKLLPHHPRGQRVDKLHHIISIAYDSFICFQWSVWIFLNRLPSPEQDFLWFMLLTRQLFFLSTMTLPYIIRIMLDLLGMSFVKDGHCHIRSIEERHIYTGACCRPLGNVYSMYIELRVRRASGYYVIWGQWDSPEMLWVTEIW